MFVEYEYIFHCAWSNFHNFYPILCSQHGESCYIECYMYVASTSTRTCHCVWISMYMYVVAVGDQHTKVNVKFFCVSPMFSNQCFLTCILAYEGNLKETLWFHTGYMKTQQDSCKVQEFCCACPNYILYRNVKFPIKCKTGNLRKNLF